jgi:hypothetical protein
MTFVIYSAPPSFPATDQNLNCVRYHLGSLWIDSDAGHAPVQADIDAILNPPLDTIDTVTLNAALTQPGSVVRALALVMFAEINKLRVKNGDAAYTMPQFTAALKAQMR